MAVIDHKDADLALVTARKVAIIGYGSQGHAHALNLKDSGVDVRVGLHEGSGWRPRPPAAGLRVTAMAEAAREADVVTLLVPDTVQGEIYRSAIAPHMAKGKTLMFAHGFNVHYGFIKPSPTSTSPWLRPSAGTSCPRSLHGGQGVPALVAIYQNATVRRLKRSRMQKAGPSKGRCDRDEFQGRNRERSVRRASCSLRRRGRS